MSYSPIADKLAARKLVILDGGTGTDIQRRGVDMDSEVWCAQANLTHPDVVREVHAGYINVGAQVITANTYASAPLMFAARGRDDMEKVDAAAMKLALEARDASGKNVCVAGSVSVMRPHKPGTDRFDPSFTWTEEDARALFATKAENLKANGAELIILEMMRDTQYSLWAAEAAMNTGLPVWVGIAVERGTDGGLHGVNHPGTALADIVKALTASGPEACLVMHSPMDVIPEAMEIISTNWSGTVGAYPEAGEFRMPDWQFVDVEPDEFRTAAAGWRAGGADIIGGCCGITPAHIEALKDLEEAR